MIGTHNSFGVSEWYFTVENQIEKIAAYYNIEGEINKERKISHYNDQLGPNYNSFLIQLRQK